MIILEFQLFNLKHYIYGKPTLMNILNKIIPIQFPNLKIQFKNCFPNKRMDAVLGIGLWKIIDLSNFS